MWRRGSALLPTLARAGIARVYSLGMGASTLPPDARRQARAFSSLPREVRADRDEFAELKTVLHQDQALTSLHGKPLFVLTADLGQQSGWSASQDKLATLSTNSAHQTTQGATHVALLEEEHYAAVSSQAIACCGSCRSDWHAARALVERAPQIPNDEQTASKHYFAFSLAAVAAALVLVAVSAAAPSPNARVPSPTGQFHVGTRTMALTDPARRDPQQTKQPRSLVIQFWYPTAADRPTRGVPVSCSGALHREKQRSGTSTSPRSEARRDRQRGAIAAAWWLARCSLLTGVRRRTRPLHQPHRGPRQPRIRGCRDRPPR